MYRYLIIVLFFSASGEVSAQFFGRASNYDECLAQRLEKSPDPKTIFRAARRACEREFETKLYNPDVKIDWYQAAAISSQQSKIKVRVTENASDFQITRVIMRFSQIRCDAIESDGDYSSPVTADFTSRFPWGKTNTEVEMTVYRRPKCMRVVDLFGKRIQ